MITTQQILFLFLLIFFKPDVPGRLRLRSETDVIILSVNQYSIKIKLTAQNDSDSTLFFLGLNGHNASPINNNDLNRFKDGVGFAVILTRNNENVPYEIEASYVNDGKFQMDTFKIMLKEGREYFMKSSVALEPHAIIQIEKNIELYGYHLRQGLYQLQIVYFQGKKCLDWADIATTQKILKDRNAFIFQGHAESNAIQIRVE